MSPVRTAPILPRRGRPARRGPAVVRLRRRANVLAAALAAAAVCAGMVALPPSGAVWTSGTDASGSWAAAATFSTASPTATASPTTATASPTTSTTTTAAPVGPVAFVRAHGAVANKVSGTSGLAVRLLAPVAAGNTIVFWMSGDQGTGGMLDANGLSRPAGETATYTPLGGTCSSQTMGVLYGLQTTVTWPAGDYALAVQPAVTAKTVVTAEFARLSLTKLANTLTPGSTCTVAGLNTVRHSAVPGGSLFLVGAVTESPTAPTLSAPWTSGGAIGTTGSGAASNAAGTLGFQVATENVQGSYTPTGVSNGGAVLIALAAG